MGARRQRGSRGQRAEGSRDNACRKPGQARVRARSPGYVEYGLVRVETERGSAYYAVNTVHIGTPAAGEGITNAFRPPRTLPPSNAYIHLDTVSWGLTPSKLTLLRSSKCRSPSRKHIPVRAMLPGLYSSTSFHPLSTIHTRLLPFPQVHHTRVWQIPDSEKRQAARMIIPHQVIGTSPSRFDLRFCV